MCLQCFACFAVYVPPGYFPATSKLRTAPLKIKTKSKQQRTINRLILRCLFLFLFCVREGGKVSSLEVTGKKPGEWQNVVFLVCVVTCLHIMLFLRWFRTHLVWHVLFSSCFGYISEHQIVLAWVSDTFRLRSYVSIMFSCFWFF